MASSPCESLAGRVRQGRRNGGLEIADEVVDDPDRVDEGDDVESSIQNRCQFVEDGLPALLHLGSLARP